MTWLRRTTTSAYAVEPVVLRPVHRTTSYRSGGASSLTTSLSSSLGSGSLSGTTLPNSYSTSNYSRYRPSGGTRIDTPTIDVSRRTLRKGSSVAACSYSSRDTSPIKTLHRTETTASALTGVERDPETLALIESLTRPSRRITLVDPERTRPRTVPRPHSEETSTSSALYGIGPVEEAEITLKLPVTASLTVTVKENAKKKVKEAPKKLPNYKIPSVLLCSAAKTIPVRSWTTSTTFSVVPSKRLPEYREITAEYTFTASKKSAEVSVEIIDSHVNDVISPKRICREIKRAEIAVERDIEDKKVEEVIMQPKKEVEAPRRRSSSAKPPRTNTAKLPRLPETALRRTFSNLTYKELTKVESVCKRWQAIVHSLLKRDVKEVTIERLGSTTMVADHQKAFKRLNVACPPTSYNFLSGILRQALTSRIGELFSCRRSTSAALRLTVDMYFLAHLDKLSLDREAVQKAFANVEELWLVVVGVSEEDAIAFERHVRNLFPKLRSATLQIHVERDNGHLNARVIQAVASSYPRADISLEVQSGSADQVYDQLHALYELTVSKLKVVCTDFDMPQLDIGRIGDSLGRQRIVTKALAFRDWCLLCSPTCLLFTSALDSMRFSSCSLRTVDDFVAALRNTEKALCLHQEQDKENVIAPKWTLKPIKKERMVALKKLELAGRCRLYGLEFLGDKAHLELERTLRARHPLLQIDSDEIYYFD